MGNADEEMFRAAALLRGMFPPLASNPAFRQMCAALVSVFLWARFPGEEMRPGVALTL
jgi:hypothetical protein